jgi:uncharacterized membrane protein YbhN (UPF0104 family)
VSADAERPPRAVTTAPTGILPSARLFAAARSAPAARRLADLVEVVGMLAGLALLGAWAVPVRPFDAGLAAFLRSAPSWLSSLWSALYVLALLPPLVVAVSALVRRRWRVLLLMAIAAAVAVVVTTAVARILGTHVTVIGWQASEGSETWPAALLGIVGATSIAAWPELVLPVRRLAIWALSLAAVALVLSGTVTLTAALGGLMVAASAGGIARLLLGTSAGHLETDEVERLVQAIGIRLQDIGESRRQPDGVIVIPAANGAGHPITVKVHGRDAVESRFASRVWRAVWYRDGAGTLTVPRPPGLAGETLVTLLVASRGARVWEVEAAGRPDRNADVLVLRSPGHRLSELDALPADLVPAAWDALDALHAAGFSHLGLSPDELVVLPDGRIALTDLRDAVSLPAADQLATDDAQLLATLATRVGVEQAVRESVALIGTQRTMDLAPFLQAAAFSGALRREVRTAHIDVDDLRTVAIRETGEEEPVLAKLRRVSLGGLVQAVLLVLAASAIISLFTGLDLDELRQSFEDASVPLMLLAFLVAQTPRPAQAVSTLGSVPARLPFGPVYAMQLATSFMNLALPSAAARMALSVRFFQRQGVPPPTAVTSGLIDSLVGNVMQAALLVLLLLFSPAALDAIPTGDSSTSTSGGGTDFSLIALIVVLVVLVVLAFLIIPRLRHAALERLHAWWPEVRAALQPLRTRHKLGQLLGGNLAAELLFAAALAMMAHAFGADITIIDALFVNVASSLIAMVIPVPGGIGVAEATLIAGLTAFGVDESTAFGITIAYRMSTFYLPPIWGWFALRWLQKRRFL